ncbi:hypothetical protein BDP27DRAFT_1430724 [Rhodocollybia butyracea]|uniref:Uncharacterized protein n=1 Tax=Rhodocollybia butyracea TaxID=206335 RepID=A0A9P5P9R5_9AGAR|nr:hypothetical protein BDP27DRAFT_1430724 [Rhodocollybia butyracea]
MAHAELRRGDSLSDHLTSSSEPSFPRGLSPPTNDYFPPMPSWTSDIPQLVVIPSDEDLAFHNLQRKPATSRRIATCSTHKTVRAARSMSFFKSESNGHPTSDKSKHSAMKSGQKQKSLVVRPHTQPYKAPYFLPPPALPPLPQDLRPQLTRARSQTMPPSLQEAP